MWHPDQRHAVCRLHGSFGCVSRGLQNGYHQPLAARCQRDHLLGCGWGSLCWMSSHPQGWSSTHTRDSRRASSSCRLLLVLSPEKDTLAHCRNAERSFPPCSHRTFPTACVRSWGTLINDTYLSSDHFPLFLLGSSLKNFFLFQTLVPPNDIWTMNQLLLVWRQSSMYLVLSWSVLNQQFSNVVHDLLGSPRPFLGFWEVTTIFERI